MTRRQVRRIIERALMKWRPITGMDRWTLTVRWADPQNELEGRTAGISATPEYLDADATFDLGRIAECGETARGIEYTVVHELAHCLTWELAQFSEERQPERRVRDACERVTSMVARALWVAEYGDEPPPR